VANDARIRRLLHELHAQPQLTQRSLAARLGIALGLTNLLLRRLAAKGWVQVVQLGGRRSRYLLTPAGVYHKARLSRDYFRDSIRFYAEARDRVQSSFSALAAEAVTDASPTRVVFWGAGELAEVGYVCLQEAQLVLVGVVDEKRRGRRFFGHPVLPPSALTSNDLDGRAFSHVVVISFEDPRSVKKQLLKAGIDAQRVRWISQ
jgi:DNA-binding MarR family transcriptional regulator